MNQGFSLFDMIRDSDFISLSMLSFIGMYGPMTMVTSIWVYRFYKALFGLGVLFCALLQGPAARNRDRMEPGRRWFRIFFHVNMVFCILMPLFLSLYYSYSTDYQPQGRYVLPALVPLCYYVVHGLEKLLLLEPGKLPGFLGRAGRQWAGKHTVPAGSRKKEGIPTAVVITLSALVAFFLLWTVWGYALPYYAANPVAP